MPFDWFPAFLQISDPLFPTGAYAHSGGLEELARLGVVHDEASLQTYLVKQLLPLLENLELPYLHFIYAAADAGDRPALTALSLEIEAWKLASEARSASLQLGSRRLESARRIFPHDLWNAFGHGEIEPHHLVVYGAQMSVCEVPLEAALSGYAYQTLAGAGGAALKLIRIGQDGVQRVLRFALGDLRQVIARALTMERADAGWFNPLMEIAAMRHATANERLFIS